MIRSQGQSQSSPISEAGRTRTILIPLDGSLRATAAWPVATALAKLVEATSHIIHVTTEPLTPEGLLHRIKLSPEQISGSIVEQLQGRPAEVIVRQAKDRSSLFIVMCTSAETEPPCEGLGNVVCEVLQTASCPVVLVDPARHRGPWKLQRLLFPCDGSPTSKTAVGAAADMAHRARAELVVLHVAAIQAKEPGSLAAPRYVDQPQHEWPVWVTEFLARIRALGHPPEDVPIRLVVGAGDIGQTIIETGSRLESDLIVLACRGLLDPTRAEIVRTVLSRAPCPILISHIEGGS